MLRKSDSKPLKMICEYSGISAVREPAVPQRWPAETLPGHIAAAALPYLHCQDCLHWRLCLCLDSEGFCAQHLLLCPANERD